MKSNKRFYKYSVIISIIMVLICAVFPEASNANSYTEIIKNKNVSKEKIKQAKNNIEFKRQKTSSIIKQLKIREKKEIDRLYTSQTNLEKTKSELQDTQTQLSSTKNKLDNLQSNLTQVTDDYYETESAVSKRIRDIYKGERIGFIHVIFAAENVNSLMDRLYYQKILTERDTKVMKELKVRAERLASYTNQMESEKNSILFTLSQINHKKKRIAQDIYTSQHLIDKLRTDRATYVEAEKELSKQSDQLASMLMHGVKKLQVFKTATGFLKPVAGGISSPFGWRRHPIFGTRSFHSGVDIAGSNYSPIRAANSGQVIYTGWYGGYGKVVIINHGTYRGVPTSTLYAHLSRVAVGRGSSVSKGQTVGYEGTTGYSTGPHLHFEVRLDGSPTNPLNYIR